MIPNREQELLIRRQQLCARSGQLRSDLLGGIQMLQPQSLLAESASAALLWARAHAGWALGGAAVVVLLRPRRIWRWSSKLFGAWQLIRRLQPIWAVVAGRRP